MFDLDELIIAEPRPLPVFVLVDTSGSMHGTKMDTVNAALHEMIHTLAKIENARGAIKVCLITFGDTPKVVQPLSDIHDIDLEILTAGGKTPMGKAFDMVREMIDDVDVVSKRAYTPMIVLLSDGLPTDIPSGSIRNSFDYQSWGPIVDLRNSERCQKSIRMALGIGNDADYGMMKFFINDSSIPVIKANDISTITKFFKWVTISVSQRSISANPNETIDVPFADEFELAELVY